MPGCIRPRPARTRSSSNLKIDPEQPLAQPRPAAVVVVGLGEEGAELGRTQRHGAPGRMAYAQRESEQRGGGATGFELAATLIGSGGVASPSAARHKPSPRRGRGQSPPAAGRLADRHACCTSSSCTSTAPPRRSARWRFLPTPGRPTWRCMPRWCRASRHCAGHPTPAIAAPTTTSSPPCRVTTQGNRR